MTPCESIRQDLIEHLYGTLETERSAQVVAHLEHCNDCQVLLGEFGQVRESLDLLEADPVSLPRPARPAMVPRSAAIAASLLVALIGTTAGHWAGRRQSQTIVVEAPRHGHPDGKRLAGKLAELHGALEPEQRATLRAVERALAANTSLAGPLASLHRGETLLQDGDPEQVVKKAAPMLARTVGTPLERPAQALLARARLARGHQLYDAGKFQQALDLLAGQSGKLKRLLEQNSKYGFAALQLLQDGEVDKLLREYPTSHVANRAFLALASQRIKGLDWRAEVARLEIIAREQVGVELSYYARLKAGQLLSEHRQDRPQIKAAARKALSYAAQGPGKIGEQARIQLQLLGD